MEHLRALYNVPAGLRILVALQAAFVAACLPALARATGIGPGFVAVALAGAFCASIAIFGRDRRAIPR